MAKENSTDPAIPQSQQIPPSKMHDLPGVFVRKQPDMAIPSKPVPASNKGQKADVKETKIRPLPLVIRTRGRPKPPRPPLLLLTIGKPSIRRLQQERDVKAKRPLVFKGGFEMGADLAYLHQNRPQ